MITLNYSTLGIDLGGSSVKYAWFNSQQECIKKESIPFDSERPREWAELIQTIAKTPPPELTDLHKRVGLSAPGLVDPERRKIVCMPGRLGGLQGLDWTEFLEQPEPVPVVNDAHAALLGECWKGAGIGVSNVIMLTLGTGVGGAAMVDGRLLSGHLGRAGHLGHTCLDVNGQQDICGTPGSLELMIGNANIRERTNGRFYTTRALLEAAHSGDKSALQVWHTSIHYLACALTSFINILDPQRIILGGGISQADDFLIQPLNTHLNSIEWRPTGHAVELVTASLGEFAGAFGAAHLSCSSTQP